MPGRVGEVGGWIAARFNLNRVRWLAGSGARGATRPTCAQLRWTLAGQSKSNLVKPVGVKALVINVRVLTILRLARVSPHRGVTGVEVKPNAVAQVIGIQWALGFVGLCWALLGFVGP